MRVLRYFKGLIRSRQAQAARDRVLSRGPLDPASVDRGHWAGSLTDPTAFYETSLRYFAQHLSAAERAHRAYFTQERRGFGEDAFHVLWRLLCEEFRPERFLEIGVYRGQVLSLVSLEQKRLGIPGKVVGISPFLPAGDSVSTYLEGIDYQADTLANFRHFNLPQPELVKAFSTDAVAVERIQAETWDLIYIDGNHDYEIALTDWENCSAHTRPGGLIVLDDSGLTTPYVPLAFATGGHPGPSQLAQEIDRSRFDEILQIGHNRVFQKR